MLFLWSSNLYHFNCLYYSTSGTVCHFNTRSLCILEVIFSNRGTSTWMLLAEPYSTVQRDSLKGRWVSHQNALSSLRKKDWFCKKGIKYISTSRLAEHLKSTVLEHVQAIVITTLTFCWKGELCVEVAILLKPYKNTLWLINKN